MLEALEIERKKGDMKLSVKRTLHVQLEGHQEPHNVGPKAHLALAHRWDLN